MIAREVGECGAQEDVFLGGCTVDAAPECRARPPRVHDDALEEDVGVVLAESLVHSQKRWTTKVRISQVGKGRHVVYRYEVVDEVEQLRR